MTSTRTYRSAVRAESARQTRDRIVAAASELFATQGWGATTIDAVAAAAGVGRKTVFDAVGGKVELLKQAYDVAIVGDGDPVPMIDRSEIRALIAETDPRRMLAGYAHVVTEVSARIHGVYRALEGAAASDPAAAELYERLQEQRRTGAEGPSGQLARMGALRPDLSPVEAGDLVYVLTDPGTYAALVVRHGWTDARFEAWLADTMIGQLLAG